MLTKPSNKILQSIRDKENLCGTNFLDWYGNLMIVLKHEKKDPPNSTPKVGINAYKKHVRGALETTYLVITTMNSELHK